MSKAKSAKAKAPKRVRAKTRTIFFLPDELAMIQELAEAHTEGNQSALIRRLVRDAYAALPRSKRRG